MSTPDSTASAALSASVIKPVFFVFLDILGDPVYANSSGTNITPTGTVFAELNGNEFLGISGNFVDISPVKAARGGSEQVTASLSGLPGIDADTIAQLNDTANWQGRRAMLWRVIRDRDNQQQGGYQHYYTGYMTSLKISADDQASQQISVTIETYLAAFSAASNRTYLDQEKYDPGDKSARVAKGIANGIGDNPATASTGTGGGGFFGGVTSRLLEK